MKQITIYDLLPLLKKGWVAMEESGLWWWMQYKPFPFKNQWHYNKGTIKPLYWLFNIAPFDGDWKDSLIKVEHKEVRYERRM